MGNVQYVSKFSHLKRAKCSFKYIFILSLFCLTYLRLPTAITIHFIDPRFVFPIDLLTVVRNGRH